VKYQEFLENKNLGKEVFKHRIIHPLSEAFLPDPFLVKPLKTSFSLSRR
jgi:hypothetical protein